jgi:hypothetical protein
MRLIATLLLLVGFSTALPSTALAKGGNEVEFVRVWPEWRAADTFLRISEFLSGKENTGRQTILRSQPDNRDGFYFLIRARSADAAYGEAKFVLEVITPDSARPKIYEFPTAITKRSHAFNLGLTGSDWKSEEIHPVAWRLRLLSAAGDELATKQSFLWALPESE